MLIYHYHPITRELLGQGTSDESPLEPGVSLIPAHATDVAPPATSDHQATVFDGFEWAIVDDYRGSEYWLADGAHHVIDELGVTIPEGALDAPPPPSPTDIIKAQIAALEAKQTPRRMREAALGIDNGWLAEIDAQIAMLRAQL